MLYFLYKWIIPEYINYLNPRALVERWGLATLVVFVFWIVIIILYTILLVLFLFPVVVILMNIIITIVTLKEETIKQVKLMRVLGYISLTFLNSNAAKSALARI